MNSIFSNAHGFRFLTGHPAPGIKQL